ncbi:MAG: sigma 54-interacting transcriptional regulator [Eubacteriales bacterium]|nr:sigma 54-interacting transcriptional regulator [Eubacteriales bacterium]
MNETKILEYVLQTIDDARLAEMLTDHRLCGVTASEIEKRFDINRANASAYLNKLVSQKKLIKIDSRPVHFMPADLIRSRVSKNNFRYVYSVDDFFAAVTPADQSDDPICAFDGLIGHDGSLKTQIEKAKAAIVYPPNGLHTLLIGESGTGKTLFARTMYNFGLEKLKKKKKDFPFVEFNCSDYYHNPQLLMSHLFGHVKGAFTGALQESAGLVEQASGGILFLDEIHRLPPEGQELLFYLMDTGCYRKLGESSNMRKASVRIIGATTEDPKNVLLKTFTRRIPLTITLPPYREKSMDEKLAIIEHIFVRESSATLKSYVVNTKIIKALCIYPFTENIGQLSSEIKVLCARSYLNNTSNQEELMVSFDLLSPAVRNYYHQNISEETLSYPSRYNTKYTIFSADRKPCHYNKLYDEEAYRNLMKRIDSFASNGYSSQQMNEELSDDIQAYCDDILKRFYDQNLHREEMYKVVGREVVDFTTDVAQTAFAELGLEVNQKNILVLSFHFKFLLERMASHKRITEIEISTLKQTASKEIAAAQKMVSRFENHFNIHISEDEEYLIALILSNMRDTSYQERPGLIIVAHGESTASSIANVCNRLMECNLVKAVDVPLEQGIPETYQNVRREVLTSNREKGVLLLVDMGSLTTFDEKLTLETGIPVRAIPNVTTLMALDITHTFLSRDANINSVYNNYMVNKPTELPRGENTSKTPAILTMCASGLGTSIAFQAMIEQELFQNNISGIQVLAVSISDIIDNSPQYQEIRSQFYLLACIGNMEISLDIPFFHISSLISAPGKKNFIDFLNKSLTEYTSIVTKDDATDTVQDECLKFLSRSVLHLNPAASVQYSEKFLISLNLPQIADNRELHLSLLLHLGFMLERCICDQKVVFDNEKEYIKQNQSMFTLLREHISILTEPFEISVNDAELCYIILTLVQYPTPPATDENT